MSSPGEIAVTADLPELGPTFQPSEEQVAAYRRDGHVKLDGVLSADEVAAFRPHFAAAVERQTTEQEGMEQKVAGTGKNWRFVDNLWTLDEAARQFILSERLGRLVADLLGVDRVRLFRDQSYFKGPGGANTPWHQDGYFMPLDTEQILTLWIPLTDVTPELAPMSYVTGSHTRGYMGTSNGDDASMDRFEDQMREQGLEVANYQTFEPGDIAAHSGWTLHASRTNTSPRMREVLVAVYFADGARVVDDPPLGAGAKPQEYYARMIRQQNRTTSLSGVTPGEPAEGPMVPLVYDRNESSA